MARGKLKPEDGECLRRNYVQLKENIDPADIVDFLVQESVISFDDKEKIQKGNTKIERCDILLEIILNSGPGDAFEKFIESLIRKNQYIHLDIVQERRKDLCYLSTDNTEIQKDTQNDRMLDKEIQISKFDLAVLLVGESGCGKSTTLKTLKNDKKINFQSNGIANAAYCGRQIQFVDSPSIDIYIPDTQKLISDATESIETISEGFHAILLVIKYHSKMETKYFQTYIERLKSLYGPNILKKYCILVITRGDLITAENVNFKDWCCQQTGAFAKLYEECGQRAVLIDNKTEEESILYEQMKNLISEIDYLQINGRRYTYLQFREAENGRKKMLIQEKEPNVTKEIMAKCTSIMDTYKNIGNHSNNNTLQLKSLYEEVEKMKQEVLEIDEGSDILSYAISLVDHLHTLVAKWMEDQITIQVMHSNKEIQEKRFLKKTSKIEAIKHGEEEKCRLNREIFILKEDNSMMKVQMKRYDDELSEFKKSKDEKLKELKTSEKLFIINCVDVQVDESSSIGQSLESVPQVKLNEEESEVICNTESNMSSSDVKEDTTSGDGFTERKEENDTDDYISGDDYVIVDGDPNKQADQESAILFSVPTNMDFLRNSTKDNNSHDVKNVVDDSSSSVDMLNSRYHLNEVNEDLSSSIDMLGKIIGVTIGCLLGMLPLLFFTGEKREEKKNTSETNLGLSAHPSCLDPVVLVLILVEISGLSTHPSCRDPVVLVLILLVGSSGLSTHPSCRDPVVLVLILLSRSSGLSTHPSCRDPVVLVLILLSRSSES
ncbi:hypothetical protein Btru_025957 [Bulinus truncatus]|nr:hypothetical protein Btru_025957 [Bulinus truncatus]